MAIVYRYTDLADNVIKYVGIVYGETRTLDQRIKEHEKEQKFQNHIWKIEYIDGIESRTDAEALEGHLIALYGTDKYLNIAKSKWGISNYLPTEFEWIEKKINYSEVYLELIRENNNEIENLKRKITELEKINSEIEKINSDKEQEVIELKKDFEKIRIMKNYIDQNEYQDSTAIINQLLFENKDDKYGMFIYTSSIIDWNWRILRTIEDVKKQLKEYEEEAPEHFERFLNECEGDPGSYTVKDFDFSSNYFLDGEEFFELERKVNIFISDHKGERIGIAGILPMIFPSDGGYITYVLIGKGSNNGTTWIFSNFNIGEYFVNLLTSLR